MARPWPIPATLFYNRSSPAVAFLGSIGAKDMAYFVLNVGDGDSQVLILPEHNACRTVLIVDAKRSNKTLTLLKALREGVPGHPGVSGTFRYIVVGTHPHLDHIAGLPKLIDELQAEVAEVWDSGYRHTGPDYMRLANVLAKLVHSTAIDFSQPTAGTTRFFGGTRVTILAPSIRLRNAYDTFGVEVNDSSLVLKVEFPLRRLPLVDKQRRLLEEQQTTVKLLLGADAQTHSWASSMIDFPTLHDHSPGVYQALRETVGTVEPLSCDILKTPHHASKHGINIELVERCSPKLVLTSSKGHDKNYFFPHNVAQEAIREALQAIAVKAKPRLHDWALGMLYTCDTIQQGDFAARPSEADAVVAGPAAQVNVNDPWPSEQGEAGSIAVVGRAPGDLAIWRFQDPADKNLRLDHALRYLGPGASSTGVL